MKNLKSLEQNTNVISKREMTCVKGGMKWTNDRSGNVYDVRYLDGWIKHRRSLTAEQILYYKYD